MKKLYTFALVFAAALFTLSCEKEVEQVTVPEEENEEMVMIHITGILDKEISKTAYDSEGKMTWVDGDKVALIVSQGAGYAYQNRNQYTLEAAYGDITEEGRNADFYGMVPYHQDGTKEWLSSGIAVYPVAISQINPSNYYNAPYIKLPSSVSGLASSIALIGLPDNETPADVTTFKFKTAMAVLKVNITDIPADATSIRLTTNNDSYPVDGDFTLIKSAGLVTVGIDKYQGWGNGYQSVDISGEDAIASRDFYFNVPVGTYPANTLAIEVRNGTQVLMKKGISKELTLSRNECLTIPTLAYLRTPVYINGSLSDPYLYTVNPAGSNTVRVCVSTEKLTRANYVKSNWKEGNRFSYSSTFRLLNLGGPGGADVIISSGDYYLQYIVCSTSTQPNSLSDDNVMLFGSVPFHYCDSADKMPVAESWLNVPYVSTAEGAVANLVDGNDGTFWHSPYGSEDPARNATYGQIISVDLDEGSLATDGNFYFSFATRNVQNNHAKAMDVYVSNVRWDDAGFDAGKVKVGSTTNALDGINPSTDKWIMNPIVCTGPGSDFYRYITVCILEDSNGNDLRTSGCTHVAEIEFYYR